jgi:hypothetical protein
MPPLEDLFFTNEKSTRHFSLMKNQQGTSLDALMD